MVFADVTKRQANEALHKARNALSSHLENTPPVVIQLDAHRRVTQRSGCATEIFGWNDAETFGRTLDELALFEEESRTRFDHELQLARPAKCHAFLPSLAATSAKTDSPTASGL